MNTKCRAVASASLLLASGSVGNATVDRTIGPQSVTGGSFDVLFGTPVLDATDLVSISDGSVFTGEAGAFVISAILTDDQAVPLFSYTTPFADWSKNFTLAAITGNNFTDFVTPSPVKGLRFSATNSNPGPDPTITLPAAIAAFTVVPEPTIAVCLAAGILLLGMMRWRTAGVPNS